MELGKYLVRELGYEDSVDTLGRWMSHHLAELINKVENAATADEREQTQISVIETILKIWDHRASMPGEVYPIKSYKDVLKMLDLLKPDNNPFDYFWRYDNKKIDQLAAGIFDNLIRIIIAILLMKIEPQKRFQEIDSSVFNTLNDEEKHILTSLQEWGSLFEVKEKKRTATKAEKKKGQAGGDSLNLNTIMLKLIENTIKNLEELRSELPDNA